jgi:hypothetical protein
VIWSAQLPSVPIGVEVLRNKNCVLVGTGNKILVYSLVQERCQLLYKSKSRTPLTISLSSLEYPEWDDTVLVVRTSTNFTAVQFPGTVSEQVMCHTHACNDLNLIF